MPRTVRPPVQEAPGIADYAFISDCRSAALIARNGSVDWCCMPRFDAGSCFGRLIDWEHAGYFWIGPASRNATVFRRYLDGTLVLETIVHAPGGEARILDVMPLPAQNADRETRLLRIVDGIRGRVDLRVAVIARFDYGAVSPWVRSHGEHLHSAIGGNDGLLIASDAALEKSGKHDLTGRFTVRAGDRVRTWTDWVRPETISDQVAREMPSSEAIDGSVDDTIDRWRRWSGAGSLPGPLTAGALRSATVLKGLTYAPTGAIVAAATTSLPEARRGGRTWDYRYNWIRDSAMTVRSLAELGFVDEADWLRSFVQRSAAGSVDDLQVAYGVGGERRLVEEELDEPAGFHGIRPVRIGNRAGRQLQLDLHGYLVALTWEWHRRGHSPSDDYWEFLVEVVNAAAERWPRPDRGIWEVRGRSRHFVHSKVMCWMALDCGLRLADECMRRAPVGRWRAQRSRLAETIDQRGVDRRTGAFTRSFDSRQPDAALLLIPLSGFVAWDDERMVATVDAVLDRLVHDDLVWRYRGPDGLAGREGAFLPASFWLAECLARQSRFDLARRIYDRALAAANDIGLFSEEYDPEQDAAMGNVPQGLTHLSHIAAAVALTQTAPMTPTAGAW